MVHYCRIDLSVEVDENGCSRPNMLGETIIKLHRAVVLTPALDTLIANQLERLVTALRAGKGLIRP